MVYNDLDSLQIDVPDQMEYNLTDSYQQEGQIDKVLIHHYNALDPLDSLGFRSSSNQILIVDDQIFNINALKAVL